MKPKFKVGDIICWCEWGFPVNAESSHPNHGLIIDVYKVEDNFFNKFAYTIIRRINPRSDIVKSDWYVANYIESFARRAYPNFWDAAEVELLKKKHLEFQLIEIIEK